MPLLQGYVIKRNCWYQRASLKDMTSLASAVICLKKVPPLTCYNLYIDGSIATIFGTNVAEKVGNQTVLYFPTSPN